MSEFGKFYKEGELDFSTVVPAYQEAFSGWPWYEVSKCVDTNRPQRCAGGLSKVALNDTCIPCSNQPNRQAYEASELIERFKTLEATRPTSWYVESVDGDPALVALAWTAPPLQIAQEKYSDVPEMQDWLTNTLGDKSIIWLDEVFADKKVRAEGNLMNFGKMCKGFMSALDTTQLAYRTLTPAMVHVADKNFGAKPVDAVPDCRSLLQITGEL
jgi:hypothetical protein